MTEKKVSFLHSMKAVFWAMLGVRANKGYDEDVKKLSAKQVIIAGLIGVAAFIATLILVVRFVIGNVAG